jgi:hypothetical protein
MKPSKSNINKASCNPISSNCVDWEGGDLLGLDICPTDSVSDVVQKANEVIQQLKTELDLTDLDLSAIWGQCVVCPNPVQTLHNVLKVLISKIVELENGSSSSVTPVEVPILVQQCLQPINSITETATTQLVVEDYVKVIADYICHTIVPRFVSDESSISILQADVNQNTTDIAELKAAGELTVNIPSCVTSPSNDIVSVTNALSADYCVVKTTLGGVSALNTGLSNDIVPFTNADGTVGDNVIKLSDPSSSLFSGKAGNIGLLLAHYGAAINDLRAAVKLIQDNCCKVTCDSIVVDFDVQVSDDRGTMYLFFITKTHIPVGFSDYSANGNLITITDSAGHTLTQPIKIANQVKTGLNPGTGLETPIVIHIHDDTYTSALDTSSDYFISMNASMTDGSTTCVKCITKTITYKDTCAFCTITVSGGD